MLLYCKKCSKPREHFIFREDDTWKARCLHCNNIKGINISNHLLAIDTKLITGNGKICSIIGYGNTTMANTFDEVYYVVYPIEYDNDGHFREDRIIKIYIDDINECIERYEKDIQKIKEEENMSKLEEAKVTPIVTNVNDCKIMHFILYILLNSLSAEQITDIVASAEKDKDNLEHGVITFDIPATSYTLSLGKDDVDLTRRMIYFTNHKTKDEFKFSTYSNWDIMNSLKDIKINIVSRDHKFVRYHESTLKDILYNEALSYDYDTLAAIVKVRDKVRDYGVVPGQTIVLPNYFVLYIESNNVTYLSDTTDGSLPNIQIVAKEEKLSVIDLFYPWLDILIDQKLKYK